MCFLVIWLVSYYYYATAAVATVVGPVLIMPNSNVRLTSTTKIFKALCNEFINQWRFGWTRLQWKFKIKILGHISKEYHKGKTCSITFLQRGIF